MVNARAVAGLGTLAVGLGIGAALVCSPGVARADDFQISIDGMDLFSTVGNTANAYSGSGDIAIAFGDGAYASSEGGTGDFALADGSGADALAGGFSGDTGNDHDTAIDIGTNTGGVEDGAYAGDDDLVGDNGLLTGSGDTAIDVGANTDGEEGSFAIGGNDDDARVVGDNSQSTANFGDHNIADVLGPDSIASAEDGNNNVAAVVDPSVTDGSSAYAGYGGNSDLSAVFGDGLSSTSATSVDNLYDIMTPAGDFPGSAAATGGGFLAEVLSLF
jgi:hypothetical protein